MNKPTLTHQSCSPRLVLEDKTDFTKLFTMGGHLLVKYDGIVGRPAAFCVHATLARSAKIRRRPMTHISVARRRRAGGGGYRMRCDNAAYMYCMNMYYVLCPINNLAYTIYHTMY